MHRLTRGLVMASLCLLAGMTMAGAKELAKVRSHRVEAHHRAAAPHHEAPRARRVAAAVLHATPMAQTVTPTIRHVSIDDVPSRMVSNGVARIEVLEQGRGPTVVLLSSLGRGANDYDKIAALLVEQGFRVLRPQPRGIGRSVGPMEGLTLHDYAADIAAVIEHEASGPAIVVGHTFGNWVARTLASDRPNLVRAVVLAAGSMTRAQPESDAALRSGLREAMDKGSDLSLPEAQRLEYLRRAYFAPEHDPRIWLSGWYPAAQKAEIAALAATPADQWYAAGRAPVMVLQGEEDATTSQLSHAIQDAWRARLTLVTIPHAGHALVPEQPEAVAAVIAAYATTL